MKFASPAETTGQDILLNHAGQGVVKDSFLIRGSLGKI